MIMRGLRFFSLFSSRGKTAKWVAERGAKLIPRELKRPPFLLLLFLLDGALF
jgi:hypothetical protein